MSDLLDAVQHALCCPTGCRAALEGRIADCAAKLTKEHAQAAIKLCQEAYREKIRALITIRKEAAERADIAAKHHPENAGFEEAYRSIAKIASEALK